MKKRLLSVFLVLVLVAGLLSTAVSAENALEWNISGSVLTVSGAPVPDYADGFSAPWAEDTAKAAAVTSIVAGDGVTSIGENAFAALPNVTEITLPGTLASMAADALPSGFTATIVYPDITSSDTLTYGDGNAYSAPSVTARDDYTGAWDTFTLTKDTPTTLSRVYTPISYDAVFMADGKEVGKVPYTVESASITEPPIPAKSGYAGAWASYALTSGGITVNAVYTLETYSATFTADGATVSSENFTVDNSSISVPAVPEKTGYTGAWENYSLGASDLTIEAVYSPIVYHAYFLTDGATVGIVAFNVEFSAIQEPAVPAKSGYTGAWESYTLGADNLLIHAVYTFEPYQGTVNASYLNVRTGPTTSAAISGGLSRGSAVTITEEQSADGMTWGKLSDGRWVSLTYVGKTAAATGSSGGSASTGSYTATVSVSCLNVRSGAGLGNGVQRGLSRGASVTVVEEQSSDGMTWCRLSDGGWVSKNYLANITQAAASEPAEQPAQPTSDAYTAVVNASYLNVRGGPGTGYGCVGGLSRGTAVTVSTETSDASGVVWAQTSSGWVSKSYLTVTGSVSQPTTTPSEPAEPTTSDEAKTVLVTAGMLNVRGGPGTGYGVSGALYAGQTVSVTAISGNWGEISSGWICLDYTREIVTVDTGAFQNVYATYQTDCSTSSNNRKTNLILACQAINGTALTPGSTFSFNQVVGQRTAAKGYRLAPYYGAGSVTYGGGVCQVATTAFNAALLGNLEITTRYQHSSPVHYVAMGRDATVSFGTLDFCFRNNSDYTIVMYASCDGNTVTITLLTREAVSPAADVTLNVVQRGSTYRLDRYDQGVLNYSTWTSY
ncbi:MAG: VanW family protein [Oscillospiraceae bacterium]|nr:VanW family protein [Oscillospiraceae bacterium]